MISLPDIANEYEIIELIARGTEGEVYYAQSKIYHKCVVKASHRHADNYHFDISVLTKFSCPYLVTIYEVISFPTTTYLVMEFCPSRDLCEYMMNNRSMKEECVREIFLQILEGVSYLHDHGLVHNDIKLDNILIRDNYTVVLTDFGYMSQMGERYKEGFYGSVMYAAPEIITNDRIPRGENDIWSIGVVLYSLLSGQFPFHNDEEDHIIARRITNEKIRYPRSVPLLAADLMKLIFLPLNQRITVNRIYRHPWIRDGESKY